MAEDEIGDDLESETQPNGDDVAESFDDAVKDSGELGASIEEGVNLGGDGDVVDDEAAAEEVAEDDDSRGEEEEENEASRERRMWKPSLSKDGGGRPNPTSTSTHGHGGGPEGEGDGGDATDRIAKKGVEDGEGETLQNVPSFSNEDTYDSDSFDDEDEELRARAQMRRPETSYIESEVREIAEARTRATNNGTMNQMKQMASEKRNKNGNKIRYFRSKEVAPLQLGPSNARVVTRSLGNGLVGERSRLAAEARKLKREIKDIEVRRRESPLRNGRHSPSKKSPPRPRPAPTEQEDSNEEAAMPAATVDETDSGDIAVDGDGDGDGDGAGAGAGEAKRPRSWGKFPPQGGVDPGSLILADGGVYEHRVARRKEWEDADDGSDSEGDEEGPGPGEIAAQSVDECAALYERTTLSVKNKHWVPSRSSDILHAKLHAEWDAVDSAIRDVQDYLVAVHDRLNKKEMADEARDEAEAMRMSKRFDVYDNLVEIARVACLDQHHRLVNLQTKAAVARNDSTQLHERYKWRDNLTDKDEDRLEAKRSKAAAAEKELEIEQAAYDAVFQEEFKEAALMMYRQSKAKINSYVSHVDIIKMQMVQVLDSPERLWTWPPGGGGGGGLMLTNRLRMPAVFKAESSATTTKEEALLVKLYRLSMKLSDIRPEGQWHELDINDLMSTRSRSRRGTSESAGTGVDLSSSPPRSAGSGGRGGGHVEPYASPVASAKLTSARRRRRNSLGLHAHREEEGTGDEATGRKMSYVGDESGRYRGVVAFEGQGGYAGMWLEGMADGIGIEYSGGMLYEGQYKCDVRHGFGAITCENLTWEGSWVGGRRDGDGIESKVLPDGGILPIATTRYEKGKRVSIRRFDPEGAEVDFLLRVRGVCERARVSAREAAADGHIIRVESKVLDLGEDESVMSDSGMPDGRYKSPSKGKRRKRGVKEKSAEIMRKEKASLDMIDHKVGSAFKKMSESSHKKVEELNHKITKEGMKSGRLFGLLKSEVATPLTMEPTNREIERFLSRYRVPQELSERISNHFIHNFLPDEKLLQKKNLQQERRRLLELSQNSEWHMADPGKGLFTIQKRFRGFRLHDLHGALEVLTNDGGSGISGSTAKKASPPRNGGTTLPLIAGSPGMGKSSKLGTIVFERKRPAEGWGRHKVSDSEAVAQAAKASMAGEPLEKMSSTKSPGPAPRLRGSTLRVVRPKKKREKTAPPPPPAVEEAGGEGKSEKSPEGEGEKKKEKKSALDQLWEKSEELGKEAEDDDEMLSEEEDEPEVAMSMFDLADLLAGKEATVINVPHDMNIEQAIAAFDHKVHSFIKIKNGQYTWPSTLEVQKEIHIVGDDNARLVGKWHFNDRGVRPSTIKNCQLFLMGSDKAKDYSRLLYATSGEVRLTDCALLSPCSYAVWATNKGCVSLAGCILAGNSDGTRKSYGCAVAMGRGIVNLVSCQMENSEEFSVMSDNDGIVCIVNCVMQATEVAVLTSDRGSVKCARCTIRLLSRGAFGHLKGDEGKILFKDSIVYGDMWADGMPLRPGRILTSNNEFLPPVII